MKNYKYFLLAAVALCSLTLTACGDDDDDEGSGNNNTPASETVAYDAHGVDLGLPSGNIWSDQNVDAEAPEEIGGYYSWGAVKTYTEYTSEVYRADVDVENTGDDWGGNEKYDVVTLKYGGAWRTPSYADFNELVNNTTKEWTELNGVKGLKVTGPNGNSIFLPGGGYKVEGNVQRAGFFGAYASSSIDPGYVGAGIRAEVNAGGAGLAGYYGFHGCTVRGVKHP